MQELRLVAVSEDGSYLVLATAGRGTRFTLPVDDRLRAVVRGHFSRLGQYEIEVESPLRPKEIQARIRAGETAEEIAESAGIPVERIRWFEGPVLQEREYMAQQAQRVAVRRPGESGPGPALGEVVQERLGYRGADLEAAQWDSWKRDDGTWRVRLSFLAEGRPQAAEWVFDPRRRHISPVDEVAARLSSLELDESVSDTVTPLVPRRAGGTTGRMGAPAGGEARGGTERFARPASAGARTDAAAETQTETEGEPQAERAGARSSPAVRAEPAARVDQTAEPAARGRHGGRGRTATRGREAAASTEQPAAEPAAQAPPKEVAAAAASAATPTADGEKQPRRRKSARSRRASVPSWDEIMFGSRRPD
jgi:hypothetical protein